MKIPADFKRPSSNVIPVMSGIDSEFLEMTSRGCSVRNASDMLGSTTGGNGTIGSVSNPLS